MSKYEIQKLHSDNTKLKRANKSKKDKKAIINFIECFETIEVNSMHDLNNCKEFKFLDISERLEILNNFFKTINISEKDTALIQNMVQNNILKNKCDIEYDKINKHILNLKILKFKEKENIYIFKKDNSNLNNKHLISKKLINQLMIS